MELGSNEEICGRADLMGEGLSSNSDSSSEILANAYSTHSTSCWRDRVKACTSSWMGADSLVAEKGRTAARRLLHVSAQDLTCKTSFLSLKTCSLMWIPGYEERNRSEGRLGCSPSVPTRFWGWDGLQMDADSRTLSRESRMTQRALNRARWRSRRM
jgi:hypothetical protein